ncbi:MAG: FAD-dependent oxidoreductase, partial [Pseudomonadota bacterium]
MSRITIAGAGIFGLWQALFLARAGHEVRVVETSTEPFANAASRYAGAMIAPECEAESAPDVVRDLGRDALLLWKQTYPGLVENGTLVLAAARDQSELDRFAAATHGHINCDAGRIAELEPALGRRHARALYFESEAHMSAPDALQHLFAAARQAGARFSFDTAHCGTVAANDDCDWLIDCRGLGASDDVSTLRGVRGERLLVALPDFQLQRTIRFVHPRQPLYVVPWPCARFLIGATVIESDDPSPISVRSALELLGLAYTLHPAFGEARILEMSAGVRPCLPDNVPR